MKKFDVLEENPKLTKILFYAKRIRTVPLRVSSKKIVVFALKHFLSFVRRHASTFASTYSSKGSIIAETRYVDPKKIKFDSNDKSKLKLLIDNYLIHSYDLLGSGWCVNSYDSNSYGIEGVKFKMNVNFNIDNIINRSNIKISKNIYSMIDAIYVPHDWQIDIKSGYRWSEKSWYKKSRVYVDGADIKLPWEIGRLQHLPQIAIYACIVKNNTLYIREFRNQILDFIALNPPSYGVQWVCTMDVGIRVANMLFAYDIFTQLDVRREFIDDPFNEIFSNSIYDHGKHIIRNLEYNDTLTSNHYLSNIVGLLFVSVYLESNRETNRWLAFSIQEIISELDKQYNPDGSNFEASTSYHRLSSELIIYATSLMLGLSARKVTSLLDYKTSHHIPRLRSLSSQGYTIKGNRILLPKEYIDTLFRAGLFTYDISKPNFHIPQIGDNDSGRFIKLTPVGSVISIDEAVSKYLNLKEYPKVKKTVWDENIINHQTLLCAFSGLFSNDIFKTDLSIERSVIQSVSRGRKLNSKVLNCSYDKVSNDYIDLSMLKYRDKKKYKFEPVRQKNLRTGLEGKLYQDAGIYVFKSDRLYLLISFGPNGQNGNGGHAHNDKLSFELNVDGNDIVVDPGSYLYTPFPFRRNQFRGSRIHSTMYIHDQEQNGWENGRIGLFNMNNETKCRVISIGSYEITVLLEYRDVRQLRRFIINKNEVMIESSCNKEYTSHFYDSGLFSNGYGKLMYDFRKNNNLLV